MKTKIVPSADISPEKGLLARDYISGLDDVPDTAWGGLEQISAACHKTAVEKGWWEKYDRPEAELFKEEIQSSKLMLMVSELAEALEEIRSGKDPKHIYFTAQVEGVVVAGTYDEVKGHMSSNGRRGEPKPEGIPIELGDAVIRIFDLAERHGVDIAEAIRMKMVYNKGRSYKHGGKKL